MEERQSFLRGLLAHGKRFDLIQCFFLPRKTVKQVVAYYFLWKTTYDYQKFRQERRVITTTLMSRPRRGRKPRQNYSELPTAAAAAAAESVFRITSDESTDEETEGEVWSSVFWSTKLSPHSIFFFWVSRRICRG